MSIRRHSDEHSDEHSDDESPVRAERVDGRSASPKEPGAFEPDDLDDPRMHTTVAPRAVVAALAVPTSYASYVCWFGSECSVPSKDDINPRFLHWPAAPTYPHMTYRRRQ